MRAYFSIFFSLIFFSTLEAQLGGEHIYQFLNLPNSARIAALGGKQISLKDNDINLAYYNPSVLDDYSTNHLALNYVSYFADVKWGYVSYAWHNKYAGNVAVGMHYLNYGTFIGADELGQKTYDFRAADYALNLVWSKPLDSLFTIGVNIKPIYSAYERYSSLGIATDIGITYHKPQKLFTAALVIRNVGTQITSYTPDNREPLPFEIMLGVTQKLKYAPFRFSLLAQHLEKFDYTYEIEEEDAFQTFDDQADNETKIADFADKALRHLIVGVEFLPTKSFVFRFGYNYQRRQELKIEETVGMIGFSWGFGLKLKKMHINYGRATYHLAGASNHFSITSNLSKYYRKQN